MTASKLRDLLKSKENNSLSAIIDRAEALGCLTHALSSALPAELADCIVAANVRDDGELVVICPSPARAARLRFESTTLLAAASSRGYDVSSLTVRVSTS